jgi:ABC-type multidrug transport system fused ATPase/permease subunit
MINNITKINQVLTYKLKIKVLINLILSFFIPFLELISIGAVSALVLFVIDIETYLNYIPKFVYENFFPDLNKKNIIFVLSILMLIAILIKNVFLLYYAYFENSIKREISAYHAKILFTKFNNVSYLDHTKEDSSKYQNEVLNQSSKCSDFIFFFISLIKEILIALILIGSLLIVNLKASILLIAIGIFLSLIIYIFSSKRTRKIGAIAKNKEFELIEIVKNSFEGFKLIKLYGKKNLLSEKFNKIIQFKNKYEIRQQIIQKIPRLLFEIIFALVIVLLLISFIRENTQIKEILPFIIFLSLISIRLLPIFSNLNVTIMSLKYFEKPVEDLFNLLISKDENKITKKFKSENQKIEKIDVIKIKNLTFSYPNMPYEIIQNVNLELLPNNIYCITGKTGCGKSTFLDLLTGILTPKKGEILINNYNILANLNGWQKNIGYVAQDNFLINDSIKNNICFFDKDFNEKKFEASIINAELKEFIDQLYLKENTIVGDRGIQISGGQKQRIGLARALYYDRKILAFDEATSAVDKETENMIIQTLHKIKKDKIIIFIAHQESAIRSSDINLHMNNQSITII